jgi:hypothetical protein
MKSSGALLLAVIIAASSTSAEALSIVNAEATFDWTGLAFTTTGTLSATMISIGDRRASTSTRTTPTTPSDSATAAGSAVNGFVTLSAGAVATAPAGSRNTGSASLFADNISWFYGTGVGSLVVTVPYHLKVSSIETSDNDFTSASALVQLFTGPGVGSNPDWVVSDALSLTGAGAMSHDGVLSVSHPLSDPTWGPLVGFWLQGEVNVSAAVPEETSPVLLLMLGLLGIGAFRRWTIGA